MMELKIGAISCSHCVGVVTRTVQALDQAARVEVDLASKQVRIESTQDRATLVAALAQAGYAPD